MKNLTPIILIVVAIGLFFWQVQPLYGVVQDLRAQSADYDEALDVASELEQVRGDLANKLASFSPEDLDKLEKFLPSYMDNIRTVIDVNGVAAKYNIALKNLKTSEASAGSGSSKVYSAASIGFDFSTSYTNAVNFLRDLETSLRLMDVRSLSVKPSAAGKTGYDFSITLNTYWIPKK
ncbi:MAG: hypothetical protein AAB726_03430 [Patescibacteria group bacterium]